MTIKATRRQCIRGAASGTVALAVSTPLTLAHMVPDGSLHAPPRHLRDAPAFRVLHLDK
jgi:hypothetical protein